MIKHLLVGAFLSFTLAYLSPATKAFSLQTPENRVLSVPAPCLAASAIPGSTNLAGTNFIVSAVVSTTSRGGSASLTNEQQWVSRFTNNTFSLQSDPQGMALRPDGSIAVTGYFYNPATGLNFLTLCYAADGTPLWTNFYDGPSHGDDTASFIAAGTNSDVWVAGESMRYATNSDLTDAALVCYASDGIPLWTNRYTSGSTNGDSPTALEVDGSGNAYLKVSSVYWFPSGGGGASIGEAIVKFDPLGNALWTNIFSAAAPDSGQAPHDAEVIGLDPAGNLLVGGVTGSQNFETGTALLKLDGDDAPLWTNYQAFGFLSQFQAVQCDRQGDVIVTGDFDLATATNFTVQDLMVKYSGATGEALWTNSIAGPGYFGGGLPQALVTPAGDMLLVGGVAGTPFSSGLFQIIKFDSSGVPVWTNFNPDLGTNSELVSATLDNAGNLYLAGYEPDPTNGSLDFVTIKYTGSGVPVWTNIYDGPAGRDDYLVALAVNGVGEVFVTGQSEDSDGVRECATVAYADVLTYAPPKNFTGLDSISSTLTDAFGNSGAGSVQVWVTSMNNFEIVPLGNGLTPAGFPLGVEGASGSNAVIIEASTDLVNWQPLFTNAPVEGAVQYTDTSAAGFARRFYRAERLP